MTTKGTPITELSTEHEIRVAKLAQLKAAGIEPWPSFAPVTTQAAELQAIAKTLGEHQESTERYTVAGRIMTKRGHGKVLFCHIQDVSGTIQIYLKHDLLPSTFEHFDKLIDTGDMIWVNGPLFITRTGEPTISVLDWKLLAKCLYALPEKYHGLTDTEQRYRQRYLDLMSNPESRQKFIARSNIVRAIRTFLQSKHFLEVETPMLHPIPGGATARPFITHHNAYDIDLYLRIAPELYLKRLVVGGLERVFEINRNFRNEGVSTKHNPEFTMLEFYMAHGDYRDGIANTEALIRAAAAVVNPSLQIAFNNELIDFAKPFQQLTLEESLITIGGLSKKDLAPNAVDDLLKKYRLDGMIKQHHGAKLFALFEELVEKKITQPTFIIGYPIEVSPLAKRDPKDPSVAARFELFVMGMELANGFTELNDPFDQAERFKEQVKAKERGDEEAHWYDADYIRALEYGLMPTVGVGIGIDRLTMLLTDTASIKDVILFPTMKPRHDEPASGDQF